VIVEALACGLPVLTSRLAGAAVTVREGQTGFLLDEPRNVDEIAAKLQQLLALPRDDRDLISRSVADYAWSRVLPQYESLLAAHADPP
jgi:UDP-glucose:(heptosyl)LPS alpha-1,3-glucosyltransferase